MDKGAETMIRNLAERTGKTLEEWIDIVQKQNLSKHGEILSYLKSEHGFTHGFANLVALKARGADAGSVDDKDSLVSAQYTGKEHFLPLYNELSASVKAFGTDVEFAPKKAYVSLRRKKQFGMLQPATKTRFEISLNLKNGTPPPVFEPVTSSNAMCTHKARIELGESITEDHLNGLRQAYNEAG